MKTYFDQAFWNLTEFTLDEAKQFLNKYCGEKFCNLGETEEKLCVIPLFCKMLGDVINGSNLKHAEDAIKSKVDLYDKFIEVKFQVYHEKNKVNTSAPATRIEMKNNKEKAMKKFEKVAVLAIFGKDKISELKWNVKAKCKDILDSLSEGIEYLGIVSKFKDDKPIFIHQSFAEYFCGQWFARNTERYKEYVNHPGNSRYTFPEAVDYFMSTKLNHTNPLFSLILNTEEEDEVESSLEECADKFNELDPLGRDVLHYANLTNNYKALKYILFNGYNLTEGNVTDLDLYRPDITTPICVILLFKWLASTLKKHSQYGPLLGVLLLDPDLEESAGYFLFGHSRNSPLHVAIIRQCQENVIQFVEENLNSRDKLGLTPLHVAAFIGDKDTIKLLVNHRAEYTRDNLLGVYPHQLVLYEDEPTYNLLKQFYGSYMNEDAPRADIMAEDYVLRDLPLHNTVQKKELWKYLESDLTSDLLNSTDPKGRSVLHVAAASSCNEILKKNFTKIRYLEYTRDENGYFPHHYAIESNMESWLKDIGIESIQRCLPQEDLQIHGLNYRKLLNKIMLTSNDGIFKDDDGLALFFHFLYSSVWLKMVKEDPAAGFPASQNVDEFSCLYDVVFRSKFKPPGQNKRLLKQYSALCNLMNKRNYLALDKVNGRAEQLTIIKRRYIETLFEVNIDRSETDYDFLYRQTLEQVASIVHTHVELMWEDEKGHLRDCSCWEQLEAGGGT